MDRSLKRKLVLVVAALAVAAFAGGAYAATQSSTTNVRQAFINDVAHRLNVTPTQLRSAIKGAYLDQLNTAVARGRLTRAQAATIRDWVRRTGVVPLGALLGAGPGFARPGAVLPGPLSARPVPRFGGPPALLPRFFAPGFRKRALGVGPMVAPFGRALLFGGVLASAKYLGITPMRLLSQLRAGKSLAQIATANGKSPAGLEAGLVARARQLIDQLVAGKVITGAHGQKLLARISARIDKLIHRTSFRFLSYPAPLPGMARPIPLPIPAVP